MLEAVDRRKGWAMTGTSGGCSRTWAGGPGGYGVRVIARRLPPETPAVFDGPTVALDPGYDLESRCFYLAHALGSIARWSTDTPGTRAVFNELHAAESSRDA